MQKAEKRLSQRVEFKQVLEFELSAAKRLASSPERSARGIDISPGGLGLEADDELQKGEVVKLSVPLGLGSVNIPVFAEVRWVAPFGERFRMGFQFLT
jgi:hypothetical protein